MTEVQAKERPILVSPPLVKAYMAGHKFHTRRIVKTQPPEGSHSVRFGVSSNQGPACLYRPFKKGTATWAACRCPYGAPGDRLWVRETHYRVGHWEQSIGETTPTGLPKWRFVGTDEFSFDPPGDFLSSRSKQDPGCDQWYKRLGRFMPRKFCRLVLDVTEIRVERLQDISEEDAAAEGFSVGSLDGSETAYRAQFKSTWFHLNGEESWNANPWVWVVVTKPIGKGVRDED